MSDSNQMGDGPAVVMAQLYERTDRRGRRYLVGRLGSAKVFVTPTGQADRGDPVWQMTCRSSRYVTDEQRVLAQEAAE